MRVVDWHVYGYLAYAFFCIIGKNDGSGFEKESEHVKDYWVQGVHKYDLRVSGLKC